MWLQFIKCLIKWKVNWTINSPAYMTLMIRCHGSPPLFTLFRPIAAHRTVSILGKKNCHLPCYLTTFLHGHCHFKFSYHIDQQNFIEFFTTCLSIVGVSFYEKRVSELHFHTFTSCQWITLYLILLTWVTFSVFQELQA